MEFSQNHQDLFAYSKLLRLVLQVSHQTFSSGLHITYTKT